MMGIRHNMGIAVGAVVGAVGGFLVTAAAIPAKLIALAKQLFAGIGRKEMEPKPDISTLQERVVPRTAKTRDEKENKQPIDIAADLTVSALNKQTRLGIDAATLTREEFYAHFAQFPESIQEKYANHCIENSLRPLKCSVITSWFGRASLKGHDSATNTNGIYVDEDVPFERVKTSQ